MHTTASSRGHSTAQNGHDWARRGRRDCDGGAASTAPPRFRPCPSACRGARTWPPRQRPSRARGSNWRARRRTREKSSGSSNYTRRMNELPFARPDDFEHLVSCAAPAGGYWFVFRGTDLLVELGPPDPGPTDDLRVRQRPSWARLPLLKNHNWLGSASLRTLYLGRLRGTDCWAAELAAATEAPAPGSAWQGLRTLFSVLDDRHFAIAGRALRLGDWERTHQFCGRYGSPT